MQVELTDFRNSLNTGKDTVLERKHCLFCAGSKVEVFNKLRTLGDKKQKDVYIEICINSPTKFRAAIHQKRSHLSCTLLCNTCLCACVGLSGVSGAYLGMCPLLSSKQSAAQAVQNTRLGAKYDMIFSSGA